MHWIAPSEKDTDNAALEKRLWDTADQFRANSGLTSAQYSQPVLGRVPGWTPEMQRIRRAFHAAPGSTLLSLDYNQLGLHVLAHLTKDPALVEPLRAKADVHLQTASAVLEEPIDAITIVSAGRAASPRRSSLAS